MTQIILLEHLKASCAGRKNAQTCEKLEASFHMSGNEVRKMVASLRKKGIPLCSGKEGYFYAASAGEVYATIRELKKMRSGLDEAIAGLERSLERFRKAGDEP